MHIRPAGAAGQQGIKLSTRRKIEGHEGPRRFNSGVRTAHSSYSPWRSRGARSSFVSRFVCGSTAPTIRPIACLSTAIAVTTSHPICHAESRGARRRMSLCRPGTPRWQSERSAASRVTDISRAELAQVNGAAMSQQARCQLAYLKSGSPSRASFEPPGRTIFLSMIFSDVNGTTTYLVPSPRNPPTERTA
jgi:hypothetical protein